MPDVQLFQDQLPEPAQNVRTAPIQDIICHLRFDLLPPPHPCLGYPLNNDISCGSWGIKQLHLCFCQNHPQKEILLDAIQGTIDRVDL